MSKPELVEHDRLLENDESSNAYAGHGTFFTSLSSNIDRQLGQSRLHTKGDETSPSSTEYCESRLPESLTWKTVGFSDEIAQGLLIQVQLLLLSFCMGVLDTITFSTYHVFTSKHTGNIVFMAMALLDESPSQQNEFGIVVSFVAFVIGSAAFGWGGNFMGHRRRDWLLLNSFISTIILYAAALIQLLRVPGEATWRQLDLDFIIIAFCALASSAQFSLATNARGLELNTSVVTGAIINLATDEHALALHNPARNRRALFFLSLLAGALVGATMVRFTGPAAALMFVASCRLVIGLSFFGNHSIAADEPP